MERTLNHSALEQYSRTFSERIINQAYTHQDRVGGQAILSLSPVKQVNFFVIKALFDQWQHEIENLKSPYFDYDNEEVHVALEEFMNVLSQHILVAEPELKPLVNAAVLDTLHLLLAPHIYYRRALNSVGREYVYAEDVKEWIKYVKIHRGPLENLAERIATNGEGRISSEEAGYLLQEAARAVSLEDSSRYLSEFSQVAAIAEEDVIEAPAYQATSEEPEPEEAYAEPLEPSPAPQDESPEIPTPRTLNDELSPSQRATLADLHRQQKIENIKTYIGVNQRFMFIRELFNNDTDEYNRALDELEQKNTYIEAFNHLRNEYAQPHRWKMDSEEVVEFLEIVAKRF